MDEHRMQSQRQLAREADITPALVSQWLDPNGARPQPNAENCRKLADVFKLPILSVYVAAGYLSAEEAKVRPLAQSSLAPFRTQQLLTEVGQRVPELENAAEEASERPEKRESAPHREPRRRAASAR